MKNYKPYTSTKRHVVLTDKSTLWKGSSEKSLTKKHVSKGGRNNSGRITIRSRGGGHKKNTALLISKETKMM